MPDDNDKTLNDGNGDGINMIVGASSAPNLFEGDPGRASLAGSDNTVADPAVSKTPDDKKGAGGDANKEGKDALAAKDGEDGKDKGTDKDKDKLTPFHEHPDWQRMVKERDEGRDKIAALTAQVDLLSKQIATAGKGSDAGDKDSAGGEKTPAFRDVTTIPDDELTELLTDKPKEFFANLYAQIRHELMSEFAEQDKEKQAKTGVEATMAEFTKAHPDFTEMFGNDGGVILDYVKAHPGHNFISAYHALTEEKRINAAKEEAYAKAKEEVEANFRAKREAGTVMGNGAPVSGSTSGADSDLKDTKKHGGLLSVLTRRHLARRGVSPG